MPGATPANLVNGDLIMSANATQTGLTEAHGVGARAELLTATIGNHLREVARRDPSHPALVMPHQDIRWSYGEFDA